MTRRWNYVAGLILAVLVGVSQPLPALGGNQINPTAALVVHTRFEWGCLIKQELVANVTKEVSKNDEKGPSVYAMNNPEDVVNRDELYLLFPAKAINGLSGQFVFRLWCVSDQANQQGFLSLDWSSLSLRDRHWLFEGRLNGQGYLRGQIMYSRRPEVRKAFFSCPQAGNFRPYPVTFFYCFPLNGNQFVMSDKKMRRQWQRVSSKMEPLLLQRARAVDVCQSFLELLDEKLRAREGFLIWDYDKVKLDTIREMAASKRDRSFEVHLEEDSGKSLLVGQDNFLPHIRQKLSLKKGTGELVGAEISLRAGEE